MSSLLVIANKALSKLGVKEINSLTQQGKAADRCNSHVRDAVREVLRSHAWSHASDWKALPQLVAAPPFGYEYAYQAPAETEKIFDIRQDTDLTAPKIDFEMVRGKVVYTDAEPCYARYVVNVEADLVDAPADFIDACAFKLAAEIAIPLSKSKLFQPMTNGYVFTLGEAKKHDTQSSRERRVDENRDCKFLAERGFPSSADAEAY
ncbi:MAG: hypothetical protein GY753_11985 [Gammaproteobacteria bacterium]|nr:hypothetical protein [Gammaproteobacteria bacterium]